MTEPLPIRLYGQHIANLGQGRRGAELDWTPSRGRRQGRLEISASLPTGRERPAEAVENFFGGLLPEGPWLNRLANDVGVLHTNVHGLLTHVGADLAGALEVGAEREHRDPVVLDPARLPQMLEEASGYVLGGGGSALPGFQRKMTLTRRGDEWLLGNGTLPSTHILKPSTDLNTRATDAEDYLLALSRELGLTSFDSWTERIGGLSVVVIERYDRIATHDGAPATRLHQEDMAQALNLPWLSDAKFQRVDDRSNLTAIARLLDTDRTIFDRDEAQRVRLLRYVTFNLATGNTDAHAKNYSILRPEIGTATLAPLYDLMPLALLSEGHLGLSMWINGKRMSNAVTVDDLVAEAHKWGVDTDTATAAVTETLERLVAATRIVSAAESVSTILPGYVRTLAASLLDGGPAHVRGPIPAYYRTQIGTPQASAAATGAQPRHGDLGLGGTADSYGPRDRTSQKGSLS